MRSRVPLLACILHLLACGGDPVTIDAADASAAAVVDSGVPVATPTIDPDAGAASADATPPPSCTGKTKGAGDDDRKITFGGTQRRFLVHVPKSYAPDKAVPLVVAMHGYLESPEAQRDVTHYSDLADTRGFIVAYPEGTNTSWNAGICCGNAATTKVDDVGFIRALVAAISADYCVDAKRIFASGFSNGGFMAYRLACEASDLFAAVGSGSGQLGVSTCTPKRSVPVIQGHGTLDPIVPYGGSVVLQYPATKDNIAGWVSRNGCGAASTKASVDSATSCERWSTGCKGGADVELCTIEGGGHEWFGGTKWVGSVPPAGYVQSSRFLDFFLAHAMP